MIHIHQNWWPFEKKKVNNKVVRYLAVWCGCECTHILKEREPHVPYVMDPSSLVRSDWKPYVPYVVDAGHPYLFKRQNEFLTCSVPWL